MLPVSVVDPYAEDLKRQLRRDLRKPVGDSPDLRRIESLPRRSPPNLAGIEGAAMVEMARRRWGRARAPGSCACRSMGRDCVTHLFPHQAWALHEVAAANGLIGAIQLGGGKTFVLILAALALPNARQVVILIPPGEREKLKREYALLSEHYEVPSMVGEGWHSIREGRPVVHVVPYSVFSDKRSTTLLGEKYHPDAVIADEGHCLSNPDSARTRRVLMYWRQAYATRLVTLSGTFFAKSLMDAPHLFALALKERSPLPLDRKVAEEWATAVDPIQCPAPAGALEVLGSPVRSALNRRMAETLGVVVVGGASVDIPLRVLVRRPPPVPEAVEEALAELRAKRVRPDGQDLVEDTEVASCGLELSCGFFYRWRFPDIPKTPEGDALILDWIAKRRAWAAEVRDKLSRPRPHLDSPSLCEDAARRYWGDDPKVVGLPEWKAECWRDWRDVRDQVKPVKGDPVWVDDWLARDAAEWASSHRGVVWYQYGAFGRRIADLAGLPLHSGGPGAEAAIYAERGDRSVVASIKAHGAGRDGLQRVFSEQLLANFPSSGRTIEQVLGRLHRTGQRAAEVVAHRYAHTPEVVKAYGNALDKAEFIGDLLHGAQKVTTAER